MGFYDTMYLKDKYKNCWYLQTKDLTNTLTNQTAEEQLPILNTCKKYLLCWGELYTSDFSKPLDNQAGYKVYIKTKYVTGRIRKLTRNVHIICSANDWGENYKCSTQIYKRQKVR